ncbi:MAG: Xylose isomerase domain protein barrel [Deltaproteobacteria bacterium]|jgi:protein FrlC|nr:Xylose isomerase domain protein barrel [Deltaproteobacteria bacterium]
MILSFNTIAFSPLPIWANSYPLRECAKLIADIGYSGIEIIAGRPHAWPRDLGKGERKKICKEIANMGLKIVALCPLIAPSHNPASLHDREYKEAQDYLIQCMRLAADLGSPYVISSAGWRVHGTSAEEAWKRSLETFHKAAEEGRKVGTTLLIEAVRRVSSNLLWNSHQAVKMMKELAHPQVKLMMDTFHVWSENENIEEVIGLYANDLKHIHLEDISSLGTDRRIPGQGIENFEKLIAALEKAGYDQALSVELWGFHPEDIARTSFSFLSELLSKTKFPV